MTSGNPTLDKNLECIEKYNPQLKDKLLNLPFLTNTIDLVETELKEPNLSYNGLPLHSQIGADSEAKGLFKQTEGAPLGITIIFGMGLGYLFKEFSENSRGSIIVYEPNLEILRVTLELVDFSKEFSQKNVKIVSDSQELKRAFGSFYQYKSEAYFLYLDSYKALYENEIPSIIGEIEMLKLVSGEDFSMLRNKGFEFVSCVLNNLANTLESIPLAEFKGLYKGKIALIVSAGPTLDVNIETIKKNRGKVAIFCVGTALRSLIKNGINPDFLIIAEMIDCIAQVEGIDLSQANLIISPYTNSSILTLKAKQKFLFPSAATRGAQYWSHLTGLDISEYVAKGTVSHSALASAKILGFNKLVLVGQDLAFINNSRYTKDSVYSDLVLGQNSETKAFEYKFKSYENYRKFVITQLPKDGVFDERIFNKDHENNVLSYFNNRLGSVKGISGEMIPTDIGYAMFVGIFEEFAYENRDLELINTSMIGAQIDGFENMPLEQALDGAEAVEGVAFLTDFKFNKQLVLKNLEEDKYILERALEKFSIAKEHCFRFEREIKRRNSITKDAEKDCIALLQIYDDVTVEFFEKNRLYQMISATESLDLKHYADTSKAQGNAKIKEIFEYLKRYFDGVEGKILVIIKKIDEQKEIINESVNTAG